MRFNSKKLHSPDLRGAVMEISTVIGCSNACVFCPQETIIRAYKRLASDNHKVMKLETFSLCLQKIPREVHIHFSGFSEPWLNKECTGMVLHAHEHGFRINIFTTLVGMSLNDISLIEKIPFGRFVVHLADVNMLNSKLPYDEHQVEKIRRLQASRIRNIQYVVYGGPVHPAIAPVLSKTAHKGAIINRAGNIPRDKLKNVDSKTILKSRNQTRGKIACKKMYASELNYNVLLPSGDVVLCAMDYGMRHVIGNLLTDDYFDLFRSEEYKKIRIDQQGDESDILCRLCTDAIPDTCFHILSWTLLKRLDAMLRSYPSMYRLLSHVVNGTRKLRS
jgi:hypothetical protein